MNTATITSENTFETAIAQSPIGNGGYIAGIAKNYNPKLGMFKQGEKSYIMNKAIISKQNDFHEISHTLCEKLAWTHVRNLIYIKND